MRSQTSWQFYEMHSFNKFLRTWHKKKRTRIFLSGFDSLQVKLVKKFAFISIAYKNIHEMLRIFHLIRMYFFLLLSFLRFANGIFYEFYKFTIAQIYEWQGKSHKKMISPAFEFICNKRLKDTTDDGRIKQQLITVARHCGSHSLITVCKKHN